MTNNSTYPSDQVILFHFLLLNLFLLTFSNSALINPGMANDHGKMLQYAAAFPSLAADTNLDIQVVASGFSEPTGIAFVDNSTMLVLEKGVK